MKNVIPFYLFFLKKRKTCTHTHSSGLHECYFYSFSHFFFVSGSKKKNHLKGNHWQQLAIFQFWKHPTATAEGFLYFFFFSLLVFFLFGSISVVDITSMKEKEWTKKPSWRWKYWLNPGFFWIEILLVNTFIVRKLQKFFPLLTTQHFEWLAFDNIITNSMWIINPLNFHFNFWLRYV